MILIKNFRNLFKGRVDTNNTVLGRFSGKAPKDSFIHRRCKVPYTRRLHTPSVAKQPYAENMKLPGIERRSLMPLCSKELLDHTPRRRAGRPSQD